MPAPKNDTDWLNLAAELVQLGVNKFDAEDIAKDVATYPEPVFRLRQIADAYRDGAAYALRTAEALDKRIKMTPHRPLWNFDVSQKKRISDTKV